MRKLLVVFVLGLAVITTARSGTVSFPLRYGATERFLIDQSGVPFPIMGRTAWFITSLSVDDYHTFVDDSVARGYNTIEFHVVNHDARGNNPPFNGNGDKPFVSRLDGSAWNGSLNYGNIDNEAPDFSTPNEPYWGFVDGLLAYCETKGVLVLLFPAYAGVQGGSQGWMQEMVANGSAKMQSYGAWIASRYRDQKNLVWMMGGDFGNFNPAQTAVEGALLTGLKSVTGQQSVYFSAEWESGTIATDQETFGPAMTLNGTYSFSGDVNNLGRIAYSHKPVEPAFLLEEPYDEEGPDGNGVNPSATQPVRRFQWWGWLSSIGGYVSGNGYVWPFRSPAWRQHLNTQGTQDMARLNGFIQSIRWYKLVPSGLDGIRNLITAGGGISVSASDYVAASASLDGSLLVAYIPPAHSGTITVDMGAMSGASHARWFDPTGATYSEIGNGLPNSGMRVFTPPGDNSAGETDWVLLIEKEQPADTQPPVIAITTPKGGAIVSNSVQVTATATDNVGVSGVRFQVDGGNLGSEIFGPPYSVTWNTRQVSDGLHTVRAVARDAAVNSAMSLVKVTVSNKLTSPLVAAYAFSEGMGTTVADVSGQSNTGTIDGATWTNKGKYGSALSYDGTDWVTVNNSDSLDLGGGMTLEAWTYPTMATGVWTTIALKEAGSNGLCYMIQADPSNRPTAYITTDVGGLRGVIGPQSLPLNVWSHLAATYDGLVLRLYVNGALAASEFASGDIIASNGPLRFGGNAIWGEYFLGTIDEVRVYNRALSENEIQTDMNTPILVGTPTPTPTPITSATPTPTGSPSPEPAAQAVNLSTRMRVQTGDNVGIGGFIITGTAPRRVLLRAIGPSLGGFGIPDALADPVLELHGPEGFVVIVNNNWMDDPKQAVLIAGTGIAPNNELESAIYVELSPGSYTGIVSGNNSNAGIALIEFYDLGQAMAGKLGNISTRAFVSTGNDIVIAGFFLGNNSGSDRIVVRGIGPSLLGAGVPNALANPTLELRDSDGTLLLMNNDWQDDPSQAAELEAANLAPTNPMEAAMVVTLAPGPYTALLSGLNGTAGVGLVEVYDRGNLP